MTTRGREVFTCREYRSASQAAASGLVAVDVMFVAKIREMSAQGVGSAHPPSTTFNDSSREFTLLAIRNIQSANTLNLEVGMAPHVSLEILGPPIYMLT